MKEREETAINRSRFWEDKVKSLTVLSLFDGISCGRVALQRTNIPVSVMGLRESDLKLSDIMQKDVPEKYFYKCGFDYLGNKKVCATLHINGHDILKRVHSPNYKCHTLTCCRGGNLQKKVLDGNRVRKLTPLEYERLQTLPDNYTSVISDSQRYNSIGNGWTVDVIAHIFSFIPKED